MLKIEKKYKDGSTNVEYLPNRIIKEVNESLITVSELIQRIDGDYPKEVEE